MKTRKNCMGTVSFEHKFQGMRKPQEFIVYPIHAGQFDGTVMIQSDTRIGTVNVETGETIMAGPVASGAYAVHLSVLGKKIAPMSGEDLTILKAAIFSTAHGAAGKAENGAVQTDNSGALEVFK